MMMIVMKGERTSSLLMHLCNQESAAIPHTKCEQSGTVLKRHALTELPPQGPRTRVSSKLKVV